MSAPLPEDVEFANNTVPPDRGYDFDVMEDGLALVTATTHVGANIVVDHIATIRNTSLPVGASGTVTLDCQRFGPLTITDPGGAWDDDREQIAPALSASGAKHDMTTSGYYGEVSLADGKYDFQYWEGKLYISDGVTDLDDWDVPPESRYHFQENDYGSVIVARGLFPPFEEFVVEYRNGEWLTTSPEEGDLDSVEVLPQNPTGTFAVVEDKSHDLEITTAESEQIFYLPSHFAREQKPAPQNGGGSTREVDRSIGLLPGKYDFSCTRGKVNVYNSAGVQCQALYINDDRIQDGVSGKLKVTGGQYAPLDSWEFDERTWASPSEVASHQQQKWVPKDKEKYSSDESSTDSDDLDLSIDDDTDDGTYDAIQNEDPQPDPYAELAEWAKNEATLRTDVENSNELRLEQLVDPEGMNSVRFAATTKWFILGSLVGDYQTHLSEVAITGEIEFTRYKRSANVFAFKDVKYPPTPFDFPATYTGSGGLAALEAARGNLKALVATSSKYKYRDRQRVIVDFNEQENIVAAQEAKNEAAETARAATRQARLDAAPKSFDEMWTSGDCWGDYYVYAQEKLKLWELEFLVAVAKYAQAPSIDHHRTILTSFIEPGAAHRIHLDSELVDAIVLPAGAVHAPSDSFDAAAAVVRQTLKLDFVNFRRWYANQGA